MNTSKLCIVTLAVIVSQALCARFGRAQELYPASVHALSISTNHQEKLVYQAFGNDDIIMNCAAENGITNLNGLDLVYNRTSDSLEVVSGTNHTLVCTPLKFQGGISPSNTNHTKVERLAFVVLEHQTDATGTLAATEQFVFGPTNQILRFRLIGNLQVFAPAQGTNSAAIIKGSLVASSPFRRGGGDEDNDDHGDGRHRGHGGD